MVALFQKLIMPILAMLWASLYFFEVLQLSEKNQYLIKPVFFIMLILFVANTVGDVKEWKKNRKKISKSKENEEDQAKRIKNLKTIGLVVLISVVYLLLLRPIGFIIATFLYLTAEIFVLKTENKVLLVVIPLITTAVLFLLFTKVLTVPLPRGLLEGVL